jgi:hypothetical protein
MSFTPSVVATLATGVVIEDLRILLASLQIFNANPPTVYLYCDHLISTALPKYSGRIIVKEALNAYLGLNRATMEALPGKRGASLFFDFTMEKIELMRWVLAQESSAMFCDADICFLGPLPAIPSGTTVALSPHMIRPHDEARFGRYNAGFMWFSGTGPVDLWEKACGSSRFFEQAALEDVAAAEQLYEFPVTQNYGWWRLWQGVEHPETLLKKWSIHRTPSTSGITVNGVALGSVHTHFAEKKDKATQAFNTVIREWLGRLEKAHPPARKLLAALKN